MAGLTRKTSILFGGAGPTTAFGQFASKVLGVTQTSQDPAVIQALTNGWPQGWQNAIIAGDKASYYQDMNGAFLVFSWQMTYLLQMGIPEWDANTLYFTGSVVQGPVGSATAGEWFTSLQGGTPGSGAGQSGNTPPTSASNAYWSWINSPKCSDGGLTVNAVPRVSSASPADLVPGAITDDGVSVKIGTQLEFADNTIQTTAAINNAVVAQNVVTGSRSFNTVFQNTGLKPLFVSVSGAQPSSDIMYAYTDPSSSPTTIVASAGEPTTSAIVSQLFFIVLPGSYYKVTGGGTLLYWTEWS